MTKRRFYAPPSAFDSEKRAVKLSSEEARHARSVLRLHRGDEVYVFDGEGREFRCAITDLATAFGALKVIEEVPAKHESPLRLTLAVALLKGEKFDLVIQKATELGVDAIVPLVTERADVRIKDDADGRRKIDRWQKIAIEASKQCGRARLLRISEPKSFGPFIANSIAENGLRLMFAEREGDSFTSLISTATPELSSIVAIIGSEGGFTDDEISRARSYGWKVITFGGRTLRAETAAITVTGLLQHRWGDLK